MSLSYEIPGVKVLSDTQRKRVVDETNVLWNHYISQNQSRIPELGKFSLKWSDAGVEVVQSLLEKPSLPDKVTRLSTFSSTSASSLAARYSIGTGFVEPAKVSSEIETALTKVLEERPLGKHETVNYAVHTKDRRASGRQLSRTLSLQITDLEWMASQIAKVALRIVSGQAKPKMGDAFFGGKNPKIPERAIQD